MAKRAPDYFFRENGKIKPGFTSAGSSHSHSARPTKLKPSGSAFSQNQKELRKMDVAGASKLLRQELKEKFPGADFSVRSDRFSMGESIDVFWLDGPATNKVDNIVKKYEDIDRDPSTGEILAGGNRYASTNRRYSAETRKKAESEIELIYGANANNKTGYEQQKVIEDHLWPYLQGNDFAPKPYLKKSEEFY